MHTCTHIHACVSGDGKKNKNKKQVKPQEMYLDSTFYAVPEDFAEVKKKKVKEGDADSEDDDADDVFV